MSMVLLPGSTSMSACIADLNEDPTQSPSLPVLGVAPFRYLIIISHTQLLTIDARLNPKLLHALQIDVNVRYHRAPFGLREHPLYPVPSTSRFKTVYGTLFPLQAHSLSPISLVTSCMSLQPLSGGPASSREPQ